MKVHEVKVGRIKYRAETENICGRDHTFQSSLSEQTKIIEEYLFVEKIEKELKIEIIINFTDLNMNMKRIMIFVNDLRMMICHY